MDKKISELTENTTPLQADYLAEVTAGASRKISIASLAKSLGQWSESVADDGTVTLPTITANYSMRGTITVSSSGVINESCEFEIDSTGTVTLVWKTDNVVANADTDTNLCIGTSVANPPIVKNRLGGTRILNFDINYG